MLPNAIISLPAKIAVGRSDWVKSAVAAAYPLLLMFVATLLVWRAQYWRATPRVVALLCVSMLLLLVLTLLLSFTGYLLPWDQLAFWAVTVGTSMADSVPFIGGAVSDVLLGGDQVGAETLIRFYVLHVVLLPLILVGFLMVHLWRWRKDAMLDQAGGGASEEPAAVPEEHTS